MNFTKNFFSNLIDKAIKNEKKIMDKNGYISYELEADVTIPSEYILMMHFLGDIDTNIQEKIKIYILRIQNEEGGWPLFFNGESNLSATVKAYYALKLSGVSNSSKQMLKAKNLILKNGGAENTNVFTKITLALFGQLSWKYVPVMPIEIMKLPDWFPFNLYKISYWSRTVLVPLLIILYRKPIANNPSGTNISEVFSNRILKNKKRKILSYFFLAIDNVLRKIEPLFPVKNKEDCLKKAYNWTVKRLNGLDGIGGIFPAMVNSLIALSISSKKDHIKKSIMIRKSIDNLLVIKKNEAYCQPCLSPIWDTGWVGQSMIENKMNIKKTIEWLLKKEIKKKGDWAVRNPKLSPGGWAFQFNNDFYPDVDDTALIGMLLDRYNKKKNNKKINQCLERTRSWIIGMQSKNGGWGSFDIDNTHYYLNNIPFADHGALLDPPTSDVSARCLSFLAQLNRIEDKEIINQSIKYLLSEQEEDGSWFGRWGTNYIYGTWSVLSALSITNFPEKKRVFKDAINYLKSKQQNDGGWGEDGKTYHKEFKNVVKESTPSQTSWAILGLIAAGEIKSSEVENGINYLIKNFTKKNSWDEKYFTAVGFPKVFYLKYHGYSKYFPILAISKYSNLIFSNYQKPQFGI